MGFIQIFWFCVHVVAMRVFNPPALVTAYVLKSNNHVNVCTLHGAITGQVIVPHIMYSLMCGAVVWTFQDSLSQHDTQLLFAFSFQVGVSSVHFSSAINFLVALLFTLGV